jgi:excinuclease ABC subunit B
VFQLKTEFKPQGDQPKAIEALVAGLEADRKSQVLLGITGSGKTFTMANVIAKTGRPALIIAHNKTLAAQLYAEFKEFFPENAVEYFVSYYDYYQPEAYIPRTDTFIEKDMAINDQIDKLRLSASRSLIEREDVIIVASVSCIYGLGMPEYFAQMNLTMEVGGQYRRDEVLIHLVEMAYKRNDMDFARSTFRARGDVLEIFPSYENDLALRFEFFDDELERISEIDPLTGKVLKRIEKATIYPASHHVTPAAVRQQAMRTIRAELDDHLIYLDENEKVLERHRLKERTLYDLEMLREIGSCKGIENYSRHFSQRAPGQPPPCLLDYFPNDFLVFIDESHQTVPQLRAMFNGDRARKKSLVDFGFRLPSAYDNRPLKFEETYERLKRVVYVSATPSEWEVAESGGEVVEQVIRPTGLLDPIVEVRPATAQVDDCLDEIRKQISKGGRVLVTVLTKRLAEELTKFLVELDVKASYLHSDVKTLERMQIIRDLRLGEYDVLVGINLLREGLDIPEVSLVCILDADKEGFLRSATALIQTCGRAARNVDGRVVMYADKRTDAIEKTVAITNSRRAMQDAYNKERGRTPETIQSRIKTGLPWGELEVKYDEEPPKSGKRAREEKHEYLTQDEIDRKIAQYTRAMKSAAKEMAFEEAARYRDLMRKYQRLSLAYGN